MTEKRSVKCIGGPLDGKTFNTSCSRITTIDLIWDNLIVVFEYKCEGNEATILATRFPYTLEATQLDELCPSCFKPSMIRIDRYMIEQDGVTGPKRYTYCNDGCDAK